MSDRITGLVTDQQMSMAEKPPYEYHHAAVGASVNLAEPCTAAIRAFKPRTNDTIPNAIAMAETRHSETDNTAHQEEHGSLTVLATSCNDCFAGGNRRRNHRNTMPITPGISARIAEFTQ